MKNFMSLALILLSGCAAQNTVSYGEFQDLARETELTAKQTGRTTAVYEVSKHAHVQCDVELPKCNKNNGIEICVESTACLAHTD